MHKSVRPFIEHRGIRYYRDAQGWRASACKGHRRLHTVFWEEANGPVPKGSHLFCSDPERPSLLNIELRSAYAGMADWRGELYATAEKEWGSRLEEITGLSAAAATREGIAKRIGVSKSSATRWCRRLNIPSICKPGRKRKWDESRLRALHSKGLTQQRIAGELGVSQSVISYAIGALGLPRYPRGRRRTNLQPTEPRP